MTGLSHPANREIATRFPWDEHGTFVDVGTAQGDLAAQIALANPHLAGVGFDLPEVAPIFEEYAQGTRSATGSGSSAATSSRTRSRRPTWW